MADKESKIIMQNVDLPREEMTVRSFVSDQLPDGFKTLEPIKGLPRHPPKFRWGDDFEGWPPTRQLEYAKQLAYAMNNAADLAQQEKFEALKLLTRKERQLKAQFREHGKLKELLQQQIAQHNAEKQELYKRIVDLAAEVKQLKRANERLGKER